MFKDKKKGYKIIYEPTIKVLHYGSVIAKKSKHMQKSKKYFFKKHLKKHFSRKLFELLYNFIEK